MKCYNVSIGLVRIILRKTSPLIKRNFLNQIPRTKAKFVSFKLTVEKPMKRRVTSALVALALFNPASAISADSASINELKQMILDMKKQHEQQIQMLEKRIENAEAKAANAEQKVVSTENKISKVAAQANTKQSASNAFNPAVSVVLMGGFASYGNNQCHQ